MNREPFRYLVNIERLQKGESRCSISQKKTRDLIAILEAAVPFEVALMPEVIEQLARQQKPVVLKGIETVSKIGYLGDVSGIVCCVEPEDTKNMVVVSLTHVRVSRKLPLPRLCSIIRSIV